MDITELESFSLSDAVKFHDNLNPKLWVNDDLLPEIQDQLKKIAQDFMTYMGIGSSIVEDITISGSNAAYTYTDHSDIDLHVVVDMSKLPDSEVYQELFNAKKSLYNDRYDITVRDIPVELYVQDSEQPHVSMGEYSLLKDRWLKFPSKKKAGLNQTSTKLKYEKIGELIELALSSNDLEKVEHVIDILKRYRKAGLSKGGEFSPENLSFKLLRNHGLIKKLYNHKYDLYGEKLSIEEQEESPEEDKEQTDHEKLAAAAYEQRGAPEIAMVEAQKRIGGGVLSFCIEHTGDLYNRMHNTGYGDLGDRSSDNERRHVVLDKIEKVLRVLTNPYGFEKEHEENMESNPKFMNVDPQEYRDRLEKALKRYAEEHRKLPVYNLPQKLARLASMALGLGQYGTARLALWDLQDLAKDQEKWFDIVNVIDPKYSSGKPLNELFDTEVSKKKNKPKWSKSVFGGDQMEFVASNKRKYVVNFFTPSELSYEGVPSDYFPDQVSDNDDYTENGRVVDFEQEEDKTSVGGQAILGTGRAPEVFGIVVNTLVKYIKDKDLDWVSFNAKEPNRRTLYKAMIKKILPLFPGWKAKGPNRSGDFLMYGPFRADKEYPERDDYYESLQEEFKKFSETIRKVKDGYRLVSKKGKNLGTYPTRAGAKKRERQVQYFKHMGENTVIDQDNVYMSGHCHVMALAIKMLNPTWQIKARIGWDEDAENDEDYRIDHVYIVSPDGSAYDCRGKFKSEDELVGSDQTGGIETQLVDYTLKQLEDDVARGELKAYSKSDILNAAKFFKQQINENFADGKVKGKKHSGQVHVIGNGVNEVFDTKLSKANKPQWKLWPGDRFAEVEFKTSNNQTYNLQAYPSKDGPFDDLMNSVIEQKLKQLYPDQEEKYWKRYNNKGLYIHFIQLPKKGDKDPFTTKDRIEGTGSAAEVFSLVIDAIGKITKDLKPSYLIFGGKEPSRRKLYRRLVNTIGPTLGYKTLDISEFPHDFSDEAEAYLLYKEPNNLKEGASGYIPSKKEANDPRFKTALTVDVKPDTIQKNAKAFGFKVSRAGIPPKLRK